MHIYFQLFQYKLPKCTEEQAHTPPAATLFLILLLLLHILMPSHFTLPSCPYLPQIPLHIDLVHCHQPIPLTPGRFGPWTHAIYAISMTQQDPGLVGPGKVLPLFSCPVLVIACPLEPCLWSILMPCHFTLPSCPYLPQIPYYPVHLIPCFNTCILYYMFVYLHRW